MRGIVVLMILAFLVFSIATSLLIIESFFGEGGIEDYSIIIWNFAISIVAVVIVVTIVMYRRRKKKKKKEKKEKKEVIYFEAKEGDYRTEYY
jgi:uncharacterized BrkB/YihY/UPF0761 family membrane protein